MHDGFQRRNIINVLVFLKQNDFNKLFLLFLFLNIIVKNYLQTSNSFSTKYFSQLFIYYAAMLLNALKAEHYIISRRRPLDLVPCCIGSVSVTN